LLHDVSVNLRATPEGWRGPVASKELKGALDWQRAGKGLLKATLSRLDFPLAVAPVPADAVAESTGDEILQNMPKLDIQVAEFRLNQLDLGVLRLRSEAQGNRVHIDPLAIHNADGDIQVSGWWSPAAEQQQSSLHLTVSSPNAGKLLGRFGYADAVRGGSADLTGQLTWLGPVYAPDYPSMSGQLSLQVKNGQFAKVDPGVGRLLGILSLQALPRRITLDFRDVFSEGMQFDQISGTSQIKQGQMHTSDLNISGPAASIQLIGSVNLINETQQLSVRIVPSIGDSVALGAAVLVSPPVGVAAYLVTKVFGDPLGQIVSFDYEMTGPWADPQIRKLSGAAVGNQAPKTKE
jgi:uncharacterized protein YhdP